MICPRCKTENNSSSRFCKNCSTDLCSLQASSGSQPHTKASTVSCQGCGAVLNVNSKYCPSCGKNTGNNDNSRYPARTDIDLSVKTGLKETFEDSSLPQKSQKKKNMLIPVVAIIFIGFIAIGAYFILNDGLGAISMTSLLPSQRHDDINNADDVDRDKEQAKDYVASKDQPETNLPPASVEQEEPSVSFSAKESMEVRQVSVPSVTGMQAEDAKRALELLELVVNITFTESGRSFGEVLAQSIAKDTLIETQTEIFLEVSSGAKPTPTLATTATATPTLVVESNDYILPDSSTRNLTDNDLSSLSKEELRIARNEIYARYGRQFNDEGLVQYFNSKDWYANLPKLPVGTDPTLTKLELSNIDLIKAHEAR